MFKKIIARFLFSGVLASSWEVLIKFRWHDKKFTIMVTSRSLVHTVTHLQQFLRRYSGSKRIFRPMSASFFQLCSRRPDQMMFSLPWRSNRPNGQRILPVFCGWHEQSQPKNNKIIPIKRQKLQCFVQIVYIYYLGM